MILQRWITKIKSLQFNKTLKIYVFYVLLILREFVGNHEYFNKRNIFEGLRGLITKSVAFVNILPETSTKLFDYY